MQELDANELYRHCDPDVFDFETTDDIEQSREIIGQDRAVEAVRFGIGIQQEGYNIFALGPSGMGKRKVVRQFFEEDAEKNGAPDDWLYVNNFEESHRPKALSLPPGMGSTLRADVEELVEELQAALVGAFESEEYQARRQEIEEEVGEEQEQALDAIRERAAEEDLRLVRTPGGLAFAPVRDGEVISPEEFQQFEEEEKEQIEEQIEDLQSELQQILRQGAKLQREVQERVKELNREFAELAVNDLFEELREKYGDFEKVVAHLNAMQEDVIDNVQHFLPNNGQQQQQQRQRGGGRRPQSGQDDEDPFMRRYKVNLIVDHAKDDSAPVIYEDNPNYNNLLGRVEYVARMGALLTDFNLIKPGALQRANGGYLILEARKVLLQPFAWEGLKRALRSGEVRIESPSRMSGLLSTVSVEPEPIPLDVKVALLGDRMLYYLMSAYEPEFGELFKVMADFEDQIDWSEESQQAYARLIGGIAQEHDLRPFDRQAVARVVEHSARLAADSEKLTAHVRSVGDLLQEANYWAGEAGRDVVTTEDVQQAIDAQIYRSDRLRERMQETIIRETILIDTEGEQVGQVNGLAVLALGDFMFGRPNRITARVRLGSGEVVDIEREVDLSGPIHSKGVLILTGFLGHRYAQDHPLSLQASLVFEQSYGGVDGDSASSAELYALLSAIAQVPLKQGFAVTGSVNQHGQVQAIGGVNEKIEGFFDICQERGLTGEQGVLIPASNAKNLMLRHDVIEAVEAGDFHIYPVETIDQGIELLTGVPAGEPDDDGNYPEDSINGLVKARLEAFAERRTEFGKNGDNSS